MYAFKAVFMLCDITVELKSPKEHYQLLRTPIWEYPKTGGSLFWGPYNKDPTI